MRVVFVHQNMPGQFIHLARALAADPANQVVFITKRDDRQLANVTRLTYTLQREPKPATHHYLAGLESHILYGQAVLRVLQALLAKDFRPDLIIGHPGWGELLFVKDILPDTPMISYAEYFYSGDHTVLDTFTFERLSLDSRARRRMMESHLLTSLVAADRCWSPTRFQKQTHPPELRHKIDVVFEGVDTDRIAPDPQAVFDLGEGRSLTAKDEVVTYAARGLEPMRGFPQFIRALPRLLERRPRCQVVIAGEDKPHYGGAPENFDNWREFMLAEVPLDPSRVHFTGWLERANYNRLLQISRVHVYLTAPFALSWGLFEAMSTGCLVLASDVPPVRELIVDRKNGLFTSLTDVGRISADIEAALDHPGAEALRKAARQTIVERYGLKACLQRQLELVRRAARPKK